MQKRGEGEGRELQVLARGMLWKRQAKEMGFFAAEGCGLSLREPHQPQPTSIPLLTDATTCRVDLFYRLLLAGHKPSVMAQGTWYSGHRAGYGDGGGKAGPAPKAEEECEKPGLVFHPPDIPGEAYQR